MVVFAIPITARSAKLLLIMAEPQITDFTDVPPVGKKTVLLFWAPWHEDSAEGGSMDQVLRALAGTAPNLCFGRVQAEQVASLSSQFQVTVVPTFILLDENGKIVERVDGGDDVAEVTQAVERLSNADPSEPTDTEDTPMPSAEEQLAKRLDRLINSSEVMLFMKGVPTAARCGFSRQIVEILQEESIAFGSFDILSDETVRQELKKHSDWPTYPQLYAKGELIGGLDIVKEMKAEGGLAKQLAVETSGAAETPRSLNDRLSDLTTRSRIMLFMKGLPSAPRCGFSRKTVELLEAEGVSYDSFDILQDEEVRQGLKKYSEWPTYPQLYVDGELIGGLDILQEMKEDDSLGELLNSKS